MDKIVEYCLKMMKVSLDSSRKDFIKIQDDVTMWSKYISFLYYDHILSFCKDLKLETVNLSPRENKSWEKVEALKVYGEPCFRSCLYRI